MAAGENPVFVIHGDERAREFILQGLQHPQVHPVATTPEELNGELRSAPVKLALVGGTVGSRGPLVMCEAVRLGRQAPVLVLIDSAVNPKALQQHKNLGLPNVHYFDFGPWQDPDQDLPPMGEALREKVLSLLEVEEDQPSMESWQSALQSIQDERAQQRAEATREAQAAEAEGEPEPAASAPTPGGPPLRKDGNPEDPPFLTQMSDDDVEFAARLIERTKAIDFRAPPPPLPPPQDSADAKALQLRERIRELERNLARLAFVYKTRRKQFDQSDATTQSLRQSRAELEEQLRIMGQNHEAELARRHQEAHQREQEFSSMLSKAEQAFTQLRDQSAATIERLTQELNGKQQELERTSAKLQEVQAALEQTRAAQENAAAQSQELVHTTVERERQAADRILAVEKTLADERQAWTAERADLVGQVDELTESCGRYAEQLTNAHERLEQLEATAVELQSQLQQAQADARQKLDETLLNHQNEIERIEREAREAVEQAQREASTRLDEGQHSTQQQVETIRAEAAQERERLMGELDAARTKHQEDLAALEREWSEKTEKLKESAAVFRDAYQEHEQALKDKQATIDQLNARLEERAREIQRLERAQRGRADDEIFELRMKALEEAVAKVGQAVGGRSTQGAEVTAIPGDASSWNDRFNAVDERLAELSARLGGAPAVVAPANSMGSLGWWVTHPARLLLGLSAMVLLAALTSAGLTALMSSPATHTSEAHAILAVEDEHTAAIDGADPEGRVGVDVQAVEPALEDASDAAEPPADGAEAGAGEAGTGDEEAAEEAGAGEAEPEAPEEAASESAPGAAGPTPEPALVQPSGGAESVLPPPKGGGSEDQRKDLRKKFFKALSKRKWSEALGVGLTMRDCCRLDWEAHFRLADVHERVNRKDAAAELFATFAAQNPDNVYADEARFRAGSLYWGLGKKDVARPLLEKVAADEASKHQKKAKALLE